VLAARAPAYQPQPISKPTATTLLVTAAAEFMDHTQVCLCLSGLKSIPLA
jgi:hypothetical protein